MCKAPYSKGILTLKQLLLFSRETILYLLNNLNKQDYNLGRLLEVIFYEKPNIFLSLHRIDMDVE